MLQKTTIVGILNVTPDSFYDGGQFDHIETAVKQATKLIEEGADIIDIGGESTFVDRDEVSEEEEIERVIPVLEAIRISHPDIGLSVDTYKSSVAKKAVEAGATMINDVTAGRGDPNMFEVLTPLDCQLVLMHAKDESSRTTMDLKEYDDVVETVKLFLSERITLAESAGIDRSRIILDPGLGFFISSDPKYSFEIIARLSELLSLDCPLYVSPSRKSFLAGEEKLPPSERLEGTISASAIAVLNGASYVRTHDVEEVKRGIDVALALT